MSCQADSHHEPGIGLNVQRMQVFSESAPEKIILVSQFRPPQGQFVIEVRIGPT